MNGLLCCELWWPPLICITAHVGSSLQCVVTVSCPTDPYQPIHTMAGWPSSKFTPYCRPLWTHVHN